MTAEVLRVAAVSKSFRVDSAAPTRALRGVDLVVGAGEFVAITGPSGSGKSTLLNVVAGLESADEGDVHIAGDRFTGRKEHDLALLRRRHVGMVFQFFNLIDAVAANHCRPGAAGPQRDPDQPGNFETPRLRDR